jgi:uncharacterized protein YoxC
MTRLEKLTNPYYTLIKSILDTRLTLVSRKDNIYPMQALWSDGWFYLSAAGLLISTVLFFFLLKQYRAASEAADSRDFDADPPSFDQSVRPIYIPDEPESKPQVASIAAVAKPSVEKPVEKTAAAATSSMAKADATSGLSPAVVYLQSIKQQLETMRGELHDLTRRVDSITERDQALVERLGDIVQAVTDLKSMVHRPMSESSAKRGKKVESSAIADVFPDLAEPARVSPPKPQPKAEPKPTPHVDPKPMPQVEAKIELNLQPTPTQTPKIEPVAAKETQPMAAESKPQTKSTTPDETVRLELDALIESQIAAKKNQKANSTGSFPPIEPPQQQPSAEPSEEKPRRGPVWPV